jgi:hypothetical protein
MRLYTWRRIRLADEVGSNAILDAAGGEDGYGVAKSDRVIYRYKFNDSSTVIPGEVAPTKTLYAMIFSYVLVASKRGTADSIRGDVRRL